MMATWAREVEVRFERKRQMLELLQRKYKGLTMHFQVLDYWTDCGTISIHLSVESLNKIILCIYYALSIMLGSGGTAVNIAMNGPCFHVALILGEVDSD